MKKVIFSLKSIALVAMASMAMVSCGDDDTTPAPQPPVEEDINEGVTAPQGSFKNDGKEYKVENAGFFLHGANNAPSVINFGTEAEPNVRSLWVGVIFSGESNQDARNYMEYQFTLPTEKTTNAQGQVVYKLIFPNETEDVEARGVYAEHKGEKLSLTGLNSGGVGFNTFVYTESESSTSNESVWGADQTELLSHTYNGSFLGISITDLSVLLQKGKGVSAEKTNYKMLKTQTVQVSDLKNMEFKIK